MLFVFLAFCTDFTQGCSYQHLCENSNRTNQSETLFVELFVQHDFCMTKQFQSYCYRHKMSTHLETSTYCLKEKAAYFCRFRFVECNSLPDSNEQDLLFLVRFVLKTGHSTKESFYNVSFAFLHKVTQKQTIFLSYFICII